MILTTDFESNQEKINTLLSDRMVVESLKKDVAKKIGYPTKILEYINCITVGDFFFCGPIINLNSTSIYFDAILDGRLVFYFGVAKSNGRVSLIYNDSSVNLEPLYVIRMFKFMTLLLNAVGVKRKDLVLLTKAMAAKFLPKTWFCH